MSNEELEVLGYNNSDSSSSDSDASSDYEEPVDKKRKIVEDEYESESDSSKDPSIDPNTTDAFEPIMGVNIYARNESVIVLLKGREKILLSGIFTVRIIKGGIVYNGCHYNASKETFNFWHPLSHAIPEIKSSFYAGFEDDNDIELFDTSLKNIEYKSYDTVLQIFNSYSKNLLSAEQLFSNVKNLWIPREPFLRRTTSKEYSFDIITDTLKENVTVLRYTKQWIDCMQKLDFNHQNASHDIRVLILGGKNSGKSTFIRTLTEKILYSTETANDRNEKEALYLDLDPGQPEYSNPDCISLNRLTSKQKHFGQHFGQTNFETIRELYIGSASPQDFPSHYLESVASLISTFEEEMFAGTSCVNLPGWVKGFGLNILQKVMEYYKPTDIVYLESRSTIQHFPEIRIPDSFTSSMNIDYSPRIHRIPAGFSGNNNEIALKNRFVASDFRTFRLLCLFHRRVGTKLNWDYDFNPLIKYSPNKISFGNNGIRGIKLSQEFSSLIGENVLQAIEGTIVSLNYTNNKLTVAKENFNLSDMENIYLNSLHMITLGLVHSVNIPERYINIYVPLDSLEKLKENYNKLIIGRMHTETPFCELNPPTKVLKLENTSPFVTFDRRKKYEHVWKVRRNVKRKGHHL